MGKDGTDRLRQSMAKYQGDAAGDQTGSSASGPEAGVVIELDPGFGGMSARSEPRLSLRTRARGTAY